MAKINNKILISLACLGLLFFGGKIHNAEAAYIYEKVGFYAQSDPSEYAQEGIAFYAFDAQAENTVPVSRYFNVNNGDHFYTASDADRTTLANNPDWGYRDEGTAFYAYASQVGSSVPVYKFYNTKNGDHFYTISESDKTVVLNNPQWGYVAEGIAFYVHSSQIDETLPVWRFYNSRTGDHFYTSSEEEKNSIALLPVYRFYNGRTRDHFYTISEDENNLLKSQPLGYVFEGIAFYAYGSQADETVPVTRHYNIYNGDHFYTASDADRTTLANNPQWGYRDEGTAFYAYEDEENSSSPVYRFYDSASGDHFYTISETEKSYLENMGTGPSISVGLWNYTKAQIESDYFEIEANKSYAIKDKDGNTIATVSGSSVTKVQYDEDSYFYVSGSIAETRLKTEVRFEAADGDNASIIFNAHRPESDYDEYRGKMKIRHTDSSNNWVINTLPLEHYVWGDGETTGTGDMDHTKVMTTIFRTYGYWYVKSATKYKPYGFTIRSDSGSQIYRGYEWEEGHPKIKEAAQATRGVVATYDNDVALTPYCSWSDGRTRSFEERWGSDDYPWCKSVSDPYGKHPSMSTSELVAAGNHMVGLIGNGSVKLAADHGWSYSNILKYYFTGIDLDPVY